MIFKENCFSCYILLISVSDSISFLRYWAISVLRMFTFQVVTSYILKLTLPFQAVFLHGQEFKKKAFKYIENEKSIYGEIKSIILIIILGLSVAKSCHRL